ncbi:MAG TPA: endonuclease NucS domain-containing protein [Planctomycetaceae bacterium]|jgi:restriction system protein|nr:endonuclease NucS domain-containing protein [Planctomycetaceae bacterium]
MTRFWVVAPVECQPRELFDKVWQFDVDNNLLSIGWVDLGDVSKMNKEALRAAIASTYTKKPPATQALFANMIWSFYHDIAPGDFVIARRGRKTLAGVGRVVQAASYAPGKNPAITHPHFLEVEWRREPRDKAFSSVVFPMQTVAELSEAEYRALVEGSAAPSVLPTPNESLDDPNEFVLERYLEDFIVSNFDLIFKGKMKIFGDVDGDEVEGQQYQTSIGKIDILATEPDSKSFIVIELKKGQPSDKVVGQILRYMGWVKENLCKDGQAVKGLVICRDPDPKLIYALKMTNSIDVRYYTVSFKLT